MKDLIRRSDAIKAVGNYFELINYSRRYAKSILNKVPSADRPQGVYDAIALVNRETEREDLSEEIKNYLFCDLRKKLWGLDSRPQGEWVWGNEKKSWHKCSVCGESAYSYYDELADNVEELFDYCPNCGARMKGVDDEDN